MATDWVSTGTDPLVLARHYVSQSTALATPAQSRLGNAWRTSFDAAAAWSGELASARLIHIVMPSAEEVSFALSSGTWKRVLPRSNSSGDVVWDRFQPDHGTSVSVGADAIILRFLDGTSYEFNAKGQLSQIRSPGGHAQVLTYVGDLNTRVTDNLGRWVEFTYGAGTGGDQQPGTLLTRARTSDGKVIHYRYEDRISAGNPEFRAHTSSQDRWVLKSVTYPNGIPQVPGTNLRTVYEYLPSSVRPFLLTGVRDKTGARTAAWTYDRKGRATSSERAGGADRWRYVYDDAKETVTINFPEGGRMVASRARGPDGVWRLAPVEPSVGLPWFPDPGTGILTAGSGPCLFGIFCFGKPPPPVCMGPSEEDALERCREAADGDDDDWENFCTASRWSPPVDMDRARRCRRHAFSSPTEKKNFCYGEFGD